MAQTSKISEHVPGFYFETTGDCLSVNSFHFVNSTTLIHAASLWLNIETNGRKSLKNSLTYVVFIVRNF
jgi:hypothetical protein